MTGCCGQSQLNMFSPSRTTCCLPQDPSLVPVMLVVIWVVRLEINLKELALFVISYALGLLVWFYEQHNARKFVGANCDLPCIAPPSL